MVSNFFLLDTDVLIDFLRGNPKAIALVNKYSDRIILSTIVVTELYARVKGKPELIVLDNLIAVFDLIAVTPKIARTAGLYKRDYYKSHGLSIADAIIAASCELEKLELKTLNVKHYPMIKNLKPAYKK